MRIRALLLLLSIVTGGAAWLFFLNERQQYQSESRQVSTTPASPPRPSQTRADPETPKSPPQQSVLPRIEEILARLLESRDQGLNRSLLAELRDLLRGTPAAIASSDIQAFLAKEKDASTGLALSITSGGKLGDASSLRVFLLDYLGQINVAAAAQLGRTILHSSSSADEWAVCLRNCAWADPSEAGKAFLRTKARELIEEQGWHKRPTSGYLEAFDVIVYSGAFELTPQLALLMRNPEQKALAHAAYLTLDRLAISDAAKTLEKAALHPEWFEGRELARASLFARIDVRDATQRSILERYLLDPRRSHSELECFAGTFPNENFSVSHNLLTPIARRELDEIVGRDRASLEAVEMWLRDPRFASLRPHLTSLKSRLETFVQQAAASREN